MSFDYGNYNTGASQMSGYNYENAPVSDLSEYDESIFTQTQSQSSSSVDGGAVFGVTAVGALITTGIMAYRGRSGGGGDWCKAVNNFLSNIGNKALNLFKK